MPFQGVATTRSAFEKCSCTVTPVLNLLLSVIVCPYLIVLSEPSEVR